ncbi:MAG: alkaline phosphatase [Ruminococcaceae bacterium]|nr:alkaline phosphatase [Oscillospiraceae bacterium]
MREFMKNRNIRFIRFIAFLTVLVMLLSACGSKKPASTPTDGISATVSGSVLKNCEKALKDYTAEAGNADGAIVFSDGAYFAVVNNKLYQGQNIQPYTFDGAGETVVPAVAAFRGIPYIEDGATAKACNYSFEVTVDGAKHTFAFYIDGTVQAPKFVTLYNKDNVQISKGVADAAVSETVSEFKIKNVIYMIADGGGYDNFTLAHKVKQEMMNRGTNKLAGAKTEVTNNLLSQLGKSAVNGLYLNELLVGSANTLLQVPHGAADNYKSYITDSSAAGTALSSGYKTTYTYAGITSDRVPRASLPELARMNGMSTGVVTTKSFVDATPLAFYTGHSIDREENIDNSIQALLSGVDVVIGEGTEYGDLNYIDESTHPEISASKLGYTVARTKTELLSKAADATKLWAPILGVTHTLKELKDYDCDTTTDHITFDVDAADSAEQPSLLDMTKSALQVLGTNINNPEGFFLMIEGGALDNAAEGGYLRPTIGEYLAFDEAFGYCVDWAAKRGDTIVIAVPDHDSGGFSGIESCEKALIDSLITGKIGDEDFHSMVSFSEAERALADMGEDTSKMELQRGHTDMPVPISLYAPEGIREELLKNMTLPTAAGDVRTGDSEYYVDNTGGTLTWYASSALNPDYLIDNTKIAPAIAKTLNLGSLDDATNVLFNKVDSKIGSITIHNTLLENGYGAYNGVTFTTKDKTLSVDRNTGNVTVNGQKQDNPKIGNHVPKSVFILEENGQPDVGSFYVPYSVLTDAKLGWAVTIDCEDFGFGKVLYAAGTEAITLPAAPEGKQIIYTDGTAVYNAGDTISYSGANVALKAYTK